MAKSRYDLMTNLGVYDGYFGVNNLDLMTFPIEEFEYNSRPIFYNLRENDIYRFDKLISRYYGSVDYYDAIVLWLNNIEYLDDEFLNVQIAMPTKQDVDRFYIKYASSTR